MSKLQINTDEFSSTFLDPKTPTEKPEKKKKEMTGVSALTECVRISTENKYALKKYLLKKEEEDGKATPLNRIINDILTEWVEQHKD